jgi:hypothetical protein
MKVQNLIYVLVNFEKLEGDFELDVAMQKIDGSIEFYEIVGIAEKGRENETMNHSLVIREKGNHNVNGG